jgi:ribosomal protein L34E
MSHESMIKTSMTEALGRFLDVDVARYKLVSTNLANVDTPGYRDVLWRAQSHAQRDRRHGSGGFLGALSRMRPREPSFCPRDCLC